MMRTIFLYIMLVGLSVSAMAQEFGVAVDDASSRMAELKTSNSAIKSIAADFEMVKRVSLMTELQKSRGKMTYARATDRLALEYEEPKGNSIVIEGDKMTMTTAGKVTTVAAKQNPAMSQMVAMIKACVTGDFTSIGDKSDVECYEKDDLFTMVIKPRNARVKRYISQIVLTFNRDNSLRMMRMCEGNGDYSEYTYRNQIIEK